VRHLWIPLLALGAAAAAAAEVYTWVDERGVTHISDHPGAASAAGAGGEALGSLWESPVDPGAPRRGPGSSSRAGDRFERVLAGAVADLERGENARAIAALESLLRDEPGRPEPHWYLAGIDRERGRYRSAEGHLRAFLSSAGDDLEPQRQLAERRLAELDDEARLADPARERGTARWETLEHPHFRVRFDAELAEVSPDYALRVAGYLEEARAEVGRRLGVVPAEPMGVVLYGKAAYLHAHRHRFSFQTVGFFDGRIHVVSAAHPADDLRGLLFHEYAHAVFREQTGGDRPYWLNEGLAEISERAARGREGMSRGERVSLAGRIDAGEWIPLRRLAPSFSGLDDADARAAYLEALAAAGWIQERTSRAARSRLLRLLGQGAGDDEALEAVLGLDTEGVDAAVRRRIRDEFPAS